MVQRFMNIADPSCNDGKTVTDLNLGNGLTIREVSGCFYLDVDETENLGLTNKGVLYGSSTGGIDQDATYTYDETTKVLSVENVIGTNGIEVGNQFAVSDHSTAGSPGDVTQNTTTGFVILPAGDATIVVTNDKVSANSVVLAQIGTVDATATSIAVVPGAGSFTITANSAPTGNVNITYFVINQVLTV